MAYMSVPETSHLCLGKKYFGAMQHDSLKQIYPVEMTVCTSWTILLKYPNSKAGLIKFSTTGVTPYVYCLFHEFWWSTQKAGFNTSCVVTTRFNAFYVDQTTIVSFSICAVVQHTSCCSNHVVSFRRCCVVHHRSSCTAQVWLFQEMSLCLLRQGISHELHFFKLRLGCIFWRRKLWYLHSLCRETGRDIQTNTVAYRKQYMQRTKKKRNIGMQHTLYVAANWSNSKLKQCRVRQRS